MIPENALILVLAVVGSICLLIFGIPMYIFLYRPDDEKLERLATLFLVFLTVGAGAFQQIFIFWDQTHDLSRSITMVEIIVAACLVSTGILYGFRTATAMKIDLGLGSVAAGIFTWVWLFTTSLYYAGISLGLGFVFLLVAFMYQKKTGERVDLSSRRMYGIIQAVMITIMVFGILGPFFLRGLPATLPFVFLILAFLGVYYYNIYYREIRPIPYSELADERMEELYLNIPFDTAFVVCSDAIAMFHWPDETEMVSSDPVNGSLSFFVFTFMNFMTKSSTLITLSLERTTPVQTHVKISAITSDPVVFLPATPTGMNEEYVTRLAGNIRKISQGR